MQPNILFCLFAGVGFANLTTWLFSKQSKFIGGAIAVGLLTVQISRNYNERNESLNHVIQNAGRTLLSSLPENAILLTMGDLPGNAARYMQKCESVRPDVRLIDLEMATYPWYSNIALPSAV